LTLKQVFLFCCLFGLIWQKAAAQVPVPDFSANVTSGCGPLAVHFQDLSTGTPIYWEWDFGNGQISSLQNPGVTYNSPGTYTVTLIVRNASGTNSIRKTNYISVYPYPTVSFTSNLSQGLACSPANVQFTDQSTPGQGSISSWLWNFGDGTTSTQQNPVHSYTQAGYYNVGLTVSNSQGCSNGSIATRFIRIIPGIQVNFTSSQTSASCNAPYTLSFLNQTSGPGNLSYAWNLGNGSSPSTSTQTNPSVTYSSNTSVTVTLKAVSDLGCSADTQELVSMPTGNAVITAPASACTNVPVNFINGSSPSPLSNTWDFGDGTNSPAANPSKTYTTPGTYTVKLVNSYAACSDSITTPIQIVNVAVPVFSADKTTACQSPFTVNFTDHTAGASSWSWDFGDGSPVSTTQNPQHTYNSIGNFDIKLTVTTGTGCTGTTTMPAYIKIITPTVTINQPVQSCTGSPVTVSATVNSVDAAASYSWSAPGAAPSSSGSPTPSFTWSAAGNYTITLSITTTGGCTTAAVSSPVTIGNPSATPGTFTVSPATTICGRTPFTFTSTTNPATVWNWNFGDGTSGTGPSISHSYSKTGPFNVRLTTTNNGCAQAGNATVVHVNPPIANFGYKITACSNPNLVNFIDSSYLDPANSATYTWDFGDGTAPAPVTWPAGTTPAPPQHTYTVLKPYTVSLTITNGGCTDFISKTVDLTPLTVTIISPPAVCKNTPFLLNSTVNNPARVKSYAWVVNTVPPVLTTVPSFRLAIPIDGITTINLTVTDSNNCPFQATPASVNTIGPTAKFNTGPGGCINSPITFTDQSSPAPGGPAINSWTWNFGDGPAQNLPGPGPAFTHPYTNAGLYTISLTVADGTVANGVTCTDTYQYPSTILITAPQAGFFAKDTVYCPNAPLPFTDTSSGTIIKYAWDFGDGGTASTVNPSHPFAPNASRYTIKLSITDQFGCTDSMIRTNYIYIHTPVAAFTMTDSIGICFPLQTNFIPNGQYYDSLYWNFGDGTTSTLPNTSHFYNGYGTFPVSLVLKGGGGCIDSATGHVQVLNPQTATTFNYSPVRNCDSVRAFFTILPPADTRFTLLFADGQADSSQITSLNHLYNAPGSYGPQLLLKDSSGCIVPLQGYSAITVLGAVPFFSMDKKAFCDSSIVNFTDFTISNDRPIQETWIFGDGQTSTQTNPSHLYNTSGIHLATLNVITSNNCKENYTDTVHVWQTPHPVITVPTPYCITSPIPMLGSLVTPDVDPVNWSWNFGDGQTSSQQNPAVSYAKPGQYMINLRTSVAFGCSDSTNYNLAVNPLPSVKGPKVINTPVGIPVAIPFTYSNNVVSYTWTPDSNLSCTTCPNPLANPIFATLYVVTVTDTSNCSFSDSILVNTICNEKNFFVPNTFSPNGDGVNDVFYPRGTNLYNIQSMRIFNRWGQMVFERRDFPANSQSMGWDGTFNGRQAPSDTYVYVMEVVCNNAQVVAIRGDVTLLR
jgi:gliding motility-associated-like protein